MLTEHMIGVGENTPIRTPPAQPSAFGIGLRQERDRLARTACPKRSLAGFIEELRPGGDLHKPPHGFQGAMVIVASVGQLIIQPQTVQRGLAIAMTVTHGAGWRNICETGHGDTDEKLMDEVFSNLIKDATKRTVFVGIDKSALENGDHKIEVGALFEFLPHDLAK